MREGSLSSPTQPPPFVINPLLLDVCARFCILACVRVVYASMMLFVRVWLSESGRFLASVVRRLRCRVIINMFCVANLQQKFKDSVSFEWTPRLSTRLFSVAFCCVRKNSAAVWRFQPHPLETTNTACSRTLNRSREFHGFNRSDNSYECVWFPVSMSMCEVDILSCGRRRVA